MDSDAWTTFVHDAVVGEPDDPHVRLLRDRLRSGTHVVGVHFVAGSVSEYLVVLERLREISEQRIPHSRAFTRWSLAEGVQMATIDDEVQRFTLMLAEAFARISVEVGRDYFKSVLHERLRELRPSAVQGALKTIFTYNAETGPTKERIRRSLDTVLRERCVELVTSLHYPETNAATILDRALASWIAKPPRS